MKAKSNFEVGDKVKDTNHSMLGKVTSITSKKYDGYPVEVKLDGFAGKCVYNQGGSEFSVGGNALSKVIV